MYMQIISVTPLQCVCTITTVSEEQKLCVCIIEPTGETEEGFRRG